MQKLIIKTSTVNFETKSFDKKEIVALVASTKSQNILLDEIKSQDGVTVNSVAVSNVYLDKKETAKAVAEMVEKLSPEKILNEHLTAHILKALDGACVFYKPIVRK